MKILYIDHISPQGHIVFNRIQLNALVKLNDDICCVFRKGYFEEIDIDSVKNHIVLPECLYVKGQSIVLHRLYGFLQLLLISFKTMFKNFDVVVFSAYDPIVLFFFRFRGKVFLFNHNNIFELNNRIKLWFTKHLPKHYTHLVFNESMKERLLCYGIVNIQQQQHEPVEPFVFNMPNIKDIFDIPGNNKIVFSPSATSTDVDFVESIAISPDFNKFLENNNIMLLLKCNSKINTSKNIILIDRYLTEQEYQNLFLVADIIFLPYIKEFKYRVSAILFSVFANNKKVIVRDCEGIRAYGQRFKYNPFFDSEAQLKERILEVLKIKPLEKIYDFSVVAAKDVWKKLLK
jgi:hypothetical protein